MGAMGESIQQQDISPLFLSIQELDITYRLTKHDQHLDAVLNQKYLKIPKNISLFEQYYKEFLHMRNEFADDSCNTTLTLTELEKHVNIL